MSNRISFLNKNSITILSASLFLIFCIPINKTGHAQNSTNDIPLYVDPASKDFSQNPALLERIISSPHGYFRFINIPFSQEVCNRFRKTLQGTPSFNLHGDAHLEQYAVTELGRGLTDFDDSSTGPAIIDLMRFGVSLHLACRAQGWSDKADDLFVKFLIAYRLGINKPDIKVKEPPLVKRIRSKFKYNRQEYFKWVHSLMEPMSQDEKGALLTAMQPYIESILMQNPEITKEFFEIKKIGYLRMGIGSALDIKYLARLRGKTDKPDDDVVIEIKQVRDLSGIDCLTIPQKADPFRILVGQARIAYQPYKYVGYIRFQGLVFWIHSWAENYEEVKIGKSFKTMKDLEDVVMDIGVQLGQGHPKQIAAPLDIQLRREQLLILSKYELKMKKVCRELADQTVVAWKKFCSEIKSN